MPAESHEQIGSSPRYQMLDVWRGVVSLVVVLEHVGVALWNPENVPALVSFCHHTVVMVLRWNIGTPLFFVMSGYCIAASLVSSRRRGGNPFGFLGRRLWRIFPTYWAALLAFAVVVTVLDMMGLARLHDNTLSQRIDSPANLNLAQWIGNLTLTETWRPTVGGGEASVFTRVAWSLCYQEQFYLVCVLVLWLAPTRLGRTLAAVTAAIVLFRIGAWDAGADHRITGLFPVYWHEFAVGLAVYWRLTGLGASSSFASRRALELFVAGMLVVGCLHELVSTVAASAFGLLLIATYRWDHLTAGLNWLAPVRALGKRSYSIYLIHLPVVAIGNQLFCDLGLSGYWGRALVMVPLVTAASVGVGWAFHRLVERKFMTPPQFSRAGSVARGRNYTALPA